MLLWGILGAVLLALCVLLSLKAGVRIRYEAEQLRVWLKLGPALLSLYPPREKPPEKTKKAKKAKAEKPKKEKPPRNITAQAVKKLIEALLPLLLRALGRFRRGLRVRQLSLHLIVSAPDPAQAARRYGTVQSILWPALAAVENLVTVERRNVRTELDFSAGQTRAEGELFLTMRLYHGLVILLLDGIPCIRPLLRFLKETKPVPEKSEPNASQTAENKTTDGAA